MRCKGVFKKQLVSKHPVTQPYTGCRRNAIYQRVKVAIEHTGYKIGIHQSDRFIFPSRLGSSTVPLYQRTRNVVATPTIKCSTDHPHTHTHIHTFTSDPASV